MQTRKHSVIESLANVVIGFLAAVFIQIVIFPLFGICISLGSNLLIGGCFTALSVIRIYALRRWFTRKTERNDRAVDKSST